MTQNSFEIVDGNILRYTVQDSSDTEPSTGEIKLTQNEVFGLWLSSKMSEICTDRVISDEFKYRLVHIYRPDDSSNLEGDYKASLYTIQRESIAGRLDALYEQFGLPGEINLAARAANYAKEADSFEELKDWLITVLVSGSMNSASICSCAGRMLFGSPFVITNNTAAFTSYWLCPPSLIAECIFRVRNDNPDSKWDSYSAWEETKRVLACRGSVYFLHANSWFKSYPFFFIYDLLCRGELCDVIFDILNEPRIKTSYKVQMYNQLIKDAGMSSSDHLRKVDALYESYRQLGGANIHFWPWNYSEIKLDFTHFYKEVTHHERDQKIPHSFMVVCLPTIVEEILPSLRNATQAVALLLLIRNAKNFSPDWQERLSDEAFKRRMIQILRLEEFSDSSENIRMTNPRVREAASNIYDEFPILQKFTNLVEGD